jgi:hypothetical protein
MRARLLSALAAAGLCAGVAAAQQQQPDPAAATIAGLQQQIVAAQEEIVRLRAEQAAARDAATRADACAAKNARLVEIGNALIASYGERYKGGRFLPFDTARRRFDSELQAQGDAVYDNRLDAGPRAAATPTPAPSPSPAP